LNLCYNQINTLQAELSFVNNNPQILNELCKTYKENYLKVVNRFDNQFNNYDDLNKKLVDVNKLKKVEKCTLSRN
jgi:hypothetical protein